MDPLDSLWTQVPQDPTGDTVGDPENDWPFMARTIMGETATSVALEALDAAIARLKGLDRPDLRPAFAALVEGTWWVAAIDERLLKGFGGVRSARSGFYCAARDVAEHGKYVRGFLWARDRHTHQLPFSMDHDDTPFFGGKDSFLYISAGLIWRPSEELFEPSESRSKIGWKTTYEELLAGKSAWKTLSRCSRWYHQMAGHDPAE